MPKRKLKVFLCHSSEDKPIVRKIYQQLKKEGWIDPWLDEEKILPGDDWHLKITEAVRSTDIVIVFLSRNSINKKGYVQREFKFALDVALEEPEGSIFIIPLRLDDSKPPMSLQKWHYVDYFPANQQELAYKRILATLESKANDLEIRNALLNNIQNTSSTIYTWGNTEFVSIPKGEFLMGTDNGWDYEKPLHKVNISYDYYMARFPVTVRQYKDFLDATDRWQYLERREHWKNWEEKKNHPVVLVAWDEAMSYCQWLNSHKQERLPAGLIIRLPTETEWEKAARGTDGREWAWGNDFDLNKCNFKGNNIGTTTPVGNYSPHGDSLYGCSDMIGNVKEWVRTQSSTYKNYVSSRQENIEDIENDSEAASRLLRGGSFEDGFNCYARDYAHFGTERDDIGFRIAVAPPLGGEANFISQSDLLRRKIQNAFTMPLNGMLQKYRKK